MPDIWIIFTGIPSLSCDAGMQFIVPVITPISSPTLPGTCLLSALAAFSLGSQNTVQFATNPFSPIYVPGYDKWTLSLPSPPCLPSTLSQRSVRVVGLQISDHHANILHMHTRQLYFATTASSGLRCPITSLVTSVRTRNVGPTTPTFFQQKACHSSMQRASSFLPQPIMQHHHQPTIQLPYVGFGTWLNSQEALTELLLVRRMRAKARYLDRVTQHVSFGVRWTLSGHWLKKNK